MNLDREALWKVLRMYDLSGKQLKGIKSMYVNSLACVRVKGGENKCFRIDSGVKQREVLFLLGFSMYI